jgi:hypothetical protein
MQPSGNKIRCTAPRARVSMGAMLKEDLMDTVWHLSAAVLLSLALAGCGEKTPRLDPEGTRAYSNATPQNSLYERTLEQGESERMGN